MGHCINKGVNKRSATISYQFKKSITLETKGVAIFDDEHETKIDGVYEESL